MEKMKGSDLLGLLDKQKEKVKQKVKNKIKRKVIAIVLPVAMKIIPILLVIAIITYIIEWVIKVNQPIDTVDKIYELLDIEDVSELIQIKGDSNNGYYLDFVDDVDDKLDETIKYLNSTAGVKSGIEKDFLKKMIKAEVCTEFPNLGATVGSEGFQGITDILRIMPNKEINSMQNTGAGQETIKVKEDNDSIEITNKEEIAAQEEIIKNWSKGKELTLLATALVYDQEDSKIHEGEKIDYWTPQKDKSSQSNIKIQKDETVSYNGKYSKSVDKMTNEGLIYIGIKKDNIEGYIKYKFVEESTEENKNVKDEEAEASRYDETTQEKVTDTIDSKVYKLTYIPKSEFDEYITNGDKNVLYHFTIDDDGKLVTATWGSSEDGSIKIENNSTINLKSAVQNYIVPYAYLMYFYIEADYKNFSSDLADEILDSTIIIALEDNVATAEVKETIENKKVSQSDEYSYNWTDVSTSTQQTENCNTNIDVIYADTWCAKLVDNDIYKSDLLSVSAGQAKNIKMPGTVTDTTSNSISEEREKEKGKDTVTNEDGTTQEFSYTLYERTITENHQISNSYKSGNKELEAKESVFVDLFKDHKMYNRINDRRLLEILEKDSKTANLVNLTKYLMYMATGNDYGVKEYDFSEYKDNPFNNTGSSGDSIPLYTPILDKESFVKALKEYAKNGANNAFKTNFLPYAGDIYDWSVAAGVNPELVIITANAEQSFKAPSNAPNNYWGIAVYTQSSKGKGYASLHDGINAYAEVIKSYNVGGSKESMVTNIYNRRKDSGCNPLGYGLPGTLSGMQSLYSATDNTTHATGKSEYGNYLLNCVYRGSQSDYQRLCINGGADHADSAVFTPWESGEYTAWQVEQKLKMWNKFFGKYGTASSGGNTAIIETGKSKLGCPYVLGAKGPNSFDCSGFVYWVYKQNGIEVPGSTDAYKSYKGSSKEISWESAQPGDILIVFNTERGTTYGHAAIYLGNDSYIHAPKPGDVVKINKSGAKTNFKHVFRFY